MLAPAKVAAAASAGAAPDTAALRQRWIDFKAKKLSQRKPRGNPQPVLQSIAREADAILRFVWKSLAMPAEYALLAVGGYGRGELFPHSDVDILIVLKQAPDVAGQAQIEGFVGALWDIGMDLGHAVRTLDECLSEAAKDITVQTALIEARPVAGSRLLARSVARAMENALDPRKFFSAKMLEMRQRHVKFQDTPYSLEPNVKEAPGGLRDLHVILWVARAAGLGKSFTELAKNGLVTPQEARRLNRNDQFLKRVRMALHAATHRREDRLVFDLQTPLAEYFGFRADASGKDSRRVSEHLMQAYYWAARSVLELNLIVLQNISRRLFGGGAGEPLQLTSEFCVRDGLLDLTRDDVFESRPGAMLDVFWVMAHHPEVKGMAAPLLRHLAQSRKRIDGAFRRDPANRARFMDILRLPAGVTHAFRRMNATNVLGRYLPPFRRIVGQMQHDLFHAYTVDQHILMVLRNVRRFVLPEHAHEYPFCSQLIANFDKPWLLYVAALFHDIAKGRGGDHSVLGKVDAARFCREHGINREDTQLVVFLVEQHLLMSKVAQKQDINDPEVVQQFAAIVKTERRLRALYLLTVADIRGTSPKVWNAWKGKLLEDLFRTTLRVLGGAKIDPHAELEARKNEALRLLRLHAFPEGTQEALWKTLDVAFFMRNDGQDIAWQTRLLAGKVGCAQPVVRARVAPFGEGIQVMIYVPDQPQLFARICSYFDGAGFNILDARIHTTSQRDADNKLQHHALDTFLVTDEGRASHYRDIISLIEHQLTALLVERRALPAPFTGRPSRKSRSFPIPPSVDWRPDERGQFALLSFTATDRPGLLYAVMHLLSRYRVNVHMAKIMTLGERVEDNLLLDGPILAESKLQLQLEQELLGILAA